MREFMLLQLLNFIFNEALPILTARQHKHKVNLNMWETMKHSKRRICIKVEEAMGKRGEPKISKRHHLLIYLDIKIDEM